MARRTRRPSRRRRSAWIAALAFLSLHCGPVQRDSRTAVSIDGYRAEPVQQSHGCDNGLEHTWEHAHTGGAIAVEHEGRSGLVGGARLRVVDGRVTAYEQETAAVAPAPPSAEQSRYLLASLGGHVGHDWANIGLAAGMSVVLIDGGQSIPVPFARVALGAMDIAWFEINAGDTDPLYRTRVFSLGVGGRFEAAVLRFGFGPYGHVVPDLDPDGGGGLDLTDLDAGVMVDLDIRPIDGMGLTLSGTLGEFAAGRVGLVWTFGDD